MNKTNLMADKIVVKGFSKLLAPRSSLFALRSSLQTLRSSLLAFLFLFIAGQVEAQYISETMTLKQGWNAIYLESTPENALCDEFFADLPVTRAAAYLDDAGDVTRRIDAEGNEILQKPVTYLVWEKGETEANTLRKLVGGKCYLVYATAACSKTFLGIPSVPRMTWRKASADGEGFLNLVGVSLAPDVANVTATKYFGEGPYGTTGGTISTVGGVQESLPTVSSMSLFGTPKVESGRAYAVTSDSNGEWPGVISVAGLGRVIIPEGENFGSFAFANSGTTERTFRLRLVPSAKTDETFPTLKRELPRTEFKVERDTVDVVPNEGWEVKLAPGATCETVFRADRAAMNDPEGTYAAVLEITDLGGTQMRVHAPLQVFANSTNPNLEGALWAGQVALNAVSSLTNATPLKAAGEMNFRVLMLQPTNGAPTLLQRVVVGVDTNGAMRLFRDVAAAKASNLTWMKRLTTGMMSVTTPEVEAGGTNDLKKVFGEEAGFSWTVGENAKDNPFRHAWHPEHDGLTADYSDKTPSGDDPDNYSNPVKPELWSIGNTLVFKWDTDGGGKMKEDARGLVSGTVTWSVSGLNMNRDKTGDIVSTGVFAMKRVATGVGRVEK